MDDEFLVGTFVREEKNRFICTVRINDIEEECYIPSSCRLENFVLLNNKTVLLKKNKSINGRTRYSVFALKYRRNYIILRPAEANEIVGKALKHNRLGLFNNGEIVEKEHIIDGYKADFYLPKDNTIIEVKSIITTSSEAVFPTVYSERAISQLLTISELLNRNYKAVYLYISLNPNVKRLSLSNNRIHSTYNDLILKCIDRGMICKAYTAELKGKQTQIKTEIPIIL